MQFICNLLHREQCNFTMQLLWGMLPEEHPQEVAVKMLPMFLPRGFMGESNLHFDTTKPFRVFSCVKDDLTKPVEFLTRSAYSKIMEQTTDSEKKLTMSLPVASQKPFGRPSEFTQKIADEICEELTLGFSLRTICKAESMPCVKTVFNWFRSYPGFLQQYTRAKEEQADALAEEMLDIADNGTNDWMEKLDKEGVPIGWQLNGEHVNRSRLRVDTRKWIASKLKPKKYGDNTNTQVGLNIAIMPMLVVEGQEVLSQSQAIEHEPENTIRQDQHEAAS